MEGPKLTEGKRSCKEKKKEGGWVYLAGAALHTWYYFLKALKKKEESSQSHSSVATAQVMSVMQLLMEKTSSVSEGEPCHCKWVNSVSLLFWWGGSRETCTHIDVTGYNRIPPAALSFQSTNPPALILFVVFSFSRFKYAADRDPGCDFSVSPGSPGENVLTEKREITLSFSDYYNAHLRIHFTSASSKAAAAGKSLLKEVESHIN